MSLGGGFELWLGPNSNLGSDCMFEIGVEPFIRVQLERVALQIKDFDLTDVMGKPGLDRLGMMDAQI
jgi:hypothetical protein